MGGSSSGTISSGLPSSSLQPALQYLAGSLPVHSGMVLPLLASHNTIRLSFDLEEGDYRSVPAPLLPPCCPPAPCLLRECPSLLPPSTNGPPQAALPMLNAPLLPPACLLKIPAHPGCKPAHCPLWHGC